MDHGSWNMDPLFFRVPLKDESTGPDHGDKKSQDASELVVGDVAMERRNQSKCDWRVAGAVPKISSLCMSCLVLIWI